MSRLLVTYQSFTGKTKALAEAAGEGAKNAGAEVVLKEIANIAVDDLATADAILLATPQPFETMAGETKKLFERLWKDRERIGDGKPFGVIVCYLTDPAATLEEMDKLSGHYKFAKAGDWVTVNAGELEAGKEHCRQLGATMAKAN